MLDWMHSRKALAVACLAAALSASCARRAPGEPFDYFSNSWQVVGLKDYTDGARITPANALQLQDGLVRIRFGPQLRPLARRHVKLALDGALPVISVGAQDGAVRYDFTFWATPLPNAVDWRRAFAWPTEGENFLTWIRVRATNDSLKAAEGRVRVQHKGASAERQTEEEPVWRLGAKETAQGFVRIPFAPLDKPADFSKEDPDLWLERTIEYWRGVLAGAARIEVPCEKATQALRAAHVCQLIANDHGVLQGGEGFYDEFYIRDGGYQIMELEEAGLWEPTRKSLDAYLKGQRPDGRFESQRGQFDANGQALWVLWQYYKITGDREWLAEVYPAMRKATDWIARTRASVPADSPFAGVLPSALADGEYLWDGKHHIVGYDFWNLRGLLCTADAARVLGETEHAAALAKEAKSYREALHRVWKSTGLAHFPPSWEGKGTHWGNTETLWPTEIFSPGDARVGALIEEVRENYAGGYEEGTIRWIGMERSAIHPYMGAYTTMASLARGEHEQVVEDFYWYLLHTSASNAFPEGIYHRDRIAWNDTIPHVTGASNYAVMLRHMLVHERGDELHLLAAVPDWWLAEGEEIRVERAPTHFGELGLVVRGKRGGVEVVFDPPQRETPQRVVLHLPESRPLVAPVNGVEVSMRSDQSRRWDFPTVVALYNKTHPPAAAKDPLPDVVAAPLDKTIPRDACLFLDLTRAANTNPFTAPFGVENPGKHLFTGMPVGVRAVGGVPFHILDPRQNGGRGLVVLHSPRAPASRDWPREVELPVGAKGKRLFFLGNVHGWASRDRGTGRWGAVAEYVIHYADGAEQTVPLVTGRTIDEWALPPDAEDAYPGLEGDPWHLNVLGVKVRPVEIRKVVFRDLGTTAAPVLVAVTLER